MSHLTSRFLAMPLPDQIDSINRTKAHDIARLADFVHHVQQVPNLQDEIRTLDDVHRPRLMDLVQIYNLTHDASINLDNSIRFSMEKKFEALQALLDVVIKSHSNGLLICGPGGIGKSYTAEKVLHDANVRYKTLKGYSSNIEFYNFLHEFRNDLILIDDADSVFGDLISLNILKAVLETMPERKVSWLTPSPMLRAPATFTFKGRVIFITNLTVEKMNAHFQALMSRILFVNFDVSREDILRRLRTIARDSEYKNIPRNDRLMIVRFILANAEMIRDLSLRTLIHSYDLYLHDRRRWKNNLRFMWGARA